MDCPNCGAYNNASAFRCIRCGRALPPPDHAGSNDQQAFESGNDSSPDEFDPYVTPEQPSYRPPYSSTESWEMGSSRSGLAEPVPDYLIPSVLVTLCCCLPAGLVSVYYSAQARGRTASGDYTGAREDANRARNWMFTGVGIMAIVFLAWVCLAVAGSLGTSTG